MEVCFLGDGATAAARASRPDLVIQPYSMAGPPILLSMIWAVSSAPYPSIEVAYYSTTKAILDAYGNEETSSGGPCP